MASLAGRAKPAPPERSAPAASQTPEEPERVTDPPPGPLPPSEPPTEPGNTPTAPPDPAPNYGGDGYDPDVHPPGVVLERGEPLRVKTTHNNDGTVTLQESILRRVYPGGAKRPSYVILAAKGLTLMEAQLKVIASRNSRMSK